MGIIAVVSSPLAGYYYRHFALDSQRQSLQQIIKLQSHSIIDELYRSAEELGRSLQSDSNFREALLQRDLPQLTEMLTAQHHQYFVTADVLKLVDLVVLDQDLRILTNSPAVDSRDLNPADHCPAQLEQARARKGAQRLKPLPALCSSHGTLYVSVLMPLGGLAVKGYIQIITDPTWNLRRLAPAIGMPMRITGLDHTPVYISEDWPQDNGTGLITASPLNSNWDEPGLVIEIYNDISELSSGIAFTQLIILAITLLVTAFMVVLIFLLLQSTVFRPLKKLRNILQAMTLDAHAFGTTMPKSGLKEINDLIAGFNEMSMTLRVSYEERDRYQAELEEEIQARTADLEAARDEALQANRAKSQFLANMSHELRTPLNAIIGYSEMVADEMNQDEINPEDKQQMNQDMKRILNASRHLLSLINDVLDLSKIEAGKMELYLETVDVLPTIQSLRDTIMPLATKNNNEITISCTDDIGTMHADITKLRQTLFNILSNACKFTSDGRINIDIVKYNELGTEYISFAITDTGIGIPQDKLVHLFRAFSQADASTTRRFGGTGLGLVLSRHFCRMMGGDIAVTSDPGKGSRFTVFMPVEVKPPNDGTPVTLLLDDDDTLPPARFRQNSPPPNGQERRKYVSRILVIDDDATVRDLLSRFLSKEGFQVYTAAGGQEGLELARELLPDVVTLDIMMPEVDGWTVLSELKHDPILKEIPIIMLSMLEDRSMGFALGATDYIAKPLHRDELLTSIRRIVRTKPSLPVLVVEDEEDTREMVRRTLEREGWSTATARNGIEALGMLQDQIPSLILLDLMMPEMDGFEFLSRLRTEPHWQAIPVIVLTAMDLSQRDREFLRSGAEHIMHKGNFEKSELLSQVHFSIKTFLRQQKRDFLDCDTTGEGDSSAAEQ